MRSVDKKRAMTDRSYAIALVLILAICCLGVYVAVSGFVNSAPQSTSAKTLQPVAPSTLIVLLTNTETPSPSEQSATVESMSTIPAMPSPLGAFDAVTGTATVTGVVAIVLPTLRLPTLPVITPTQAGPLPPGAQSCAGFAYCASPGPPDASIAPTNAPCPRNYVWGRVFDTAGRGLVDVRIRYRVPNGNVGTAVSKAPPDPPGKFDIITPAPGGTWIIWVLDAVDKPASPQVAVVAPQDYQGSGMCPTRVDFRAQR